MPTDIDRHHLQELQSHCAPVVEVLPRAEFDEEHLAGAVNLPLHEIDANSAQRILGIDQQRPIVVYCQDVA